VESLGSAGSATGVEIEATSREQDGYTLFRNVFAEGDGEVSRTTETRNKGALTITTVESLGSEGSASGVEIESTEREENGFTLFRNVFADGSGEVSRSVETRNKGSLTITTVESLGSKGNASGLEIESTEREENGYTLFRNVFAVGNGEISRTTEKRNSGKLTITTVESLGTKIDADGDVELESTERQENGFILFRSVRATGNGEILRTVEKRNNNKLTITTVESLGAKVDAEGDVELESTERQENGFTLFRSVKATGNGEISRTEDLVGSQKATIVETIGNTDPTPPNGGFVKAKEETSEINNVVKKRVTFLLSDIKLSETEDKVGSQLAIVQDWFGITSDPTMPSSSASNPYVIAKVEKSDVGGIETKRYTFLKENVKLSESEDKVGSQLTKVEEWFKPDEEPDIEDYVIANVQKSNVGGIPTEKYTFLKENVKLSESEDKVGSQLAKVEEWFKPEEEPEIEDYVIAKVEKSNMGGIPTEKYTFLKENVELSRSEDKVGSQKAILTEVFKPEDDPDEGDHIVAKEETSNVQGIPTKRFTFLLPNTVISRTTDDRKGFEEDQFALTKEIIQVFKPEEEPDPTISNSVLISKEVRDEEGMPTEVFTFVHGKGEISNTESNADPALPSAVRERTIVHLGEPENEPEGVVVSKKIEQQDGYEVHTIISLENEIEGVTNEYDDYIEVEVPGEVELIEEEVSSGDVTGTIALVKVQPKRILRKLAKVKVEIIKGRGNIPAIADPAYDLGEISCSVTSTNLQLSIGPGSTVTIGAGTNNIMSDTGYVQDFKVQTSITNYPGHFLKDELLAEGSIEYISSSQPVASGNSISRNEDTVTRKTKLVGTGCSESEKSDSWREFGEISRSVRPVLVDFDGVEYYEVRTITIDPSGSSQEAS
jgi:ribosomal protein S28E/S33